MERRIPGTTLWSLRDSLMDSLSAIRYALERRIPRTTLCRTWKFEFCVIRYTENSENMSQVLVVLVPATYFLNFLFVGLLSRTLCHRGCLTRKRHCTHLVLCQFRKCVAGRRVFMCECMAKEFKTRVIPHLIVLVVRQHASSETTSDHQCRWVCHQPLSKISQPLVLSSF